MAGFPRCIQRTFVLSVILLATGTQVRADVVTLQDLLNGESIVAGGGYYSGGGFLCENFRGYQHFAWGRLTPMPRR
jgi:hypothetical protein